MENMELVGSPILYGHFSFYLYYSAERVQEIIILTTYDTTLGSIRKNSNSHRICL